MQSSHVSVYLMEARKICAKLGVLSIYHSCVAQPTSALFVCQAENSEIHLAPSCAVQAHRAEPNLDLKRQESAVNPVQVWCMGKPRYHHFNKLNLINYTCGTTGITTRQEPTVLSEPLLYWDRNSCCRAKHYSHNLKQNICVFLLQHFKYFLSANSQPMGFT